MRSGRGKQQAYSEHREYSGAGALSHIWSLESGELFFCISGFHLDAPFAVICRLNPFLLIKKTRSRTACGTGPTVVLEQREGSGPWDGVVDPEGRNSAVRHLIRWYRQQQGLSQHQVEAPTGIDRAYLRRLERRRIHLSLMVLWRWAKACT